MIQTSLKVSISDLGRGAGNQREHSLTVAAPEGLGIEVFAVPQGDPIGLEVRLESVLEGVLATVEGTARLVGECSRCLDRIEADADVDFQELFLYPEHAEGDDDADGELRVVEKDTVDLEPGLRDAIVLDLPFQPTCSDDCPGLCPECGFKLADDLEHTHGDPIDPRWSGLAGLADASIVLGENLAADDDGTSRPASP